MFADPQSITHDGAAISLPRIGSGPTSGSFRSADGKFTMLLSHDAKRRNRHVARLTCDKVASDPLQPATNRPYSMSAYMVLDVPLFGFSTTEQLNVGTALTWFLHETAGARIGRLLAGES